MEIKKGGRRSKKKTRRKEKQENDEEKGEIGKGISGEAADIGREVTERRKVTKTYEKEEQEKAQVEEEEVRGEGKLGVVPAFTHQLNEEFVFFAA